MICTLCGKNKSFKEFDISLLTKNTFPRCKECRKENLTSNIRLYIQNYKDERQVKSIVNRDENQRKKRRILYKKREREKNKNNIIQKKSIAERVYIKLLQKRYKISMADYNIILNKQKGRCAICNIYPTTKRRLGVDHNHNTGQIRGILCTRCNSLIAALENKLLKQAKIYLKKWSKLGK